MWRAPPFPHLRVIKSLYLIQLTLNWSWTPLFFCYHLMGISLLVLVLMDILVGAIVWLTYRKVPPVSFLLVPYLVWILFATYLNFYIGWHHS